jgi:hypothetical protein
MLAEFVQYAGAILPHHGEDHTLANTKAAMQRTLAGMVGIHHQSKLRLPMPFSGTVGAGPSSATPELGAPRFEECSVLGHQIEIAPQVGAVFIGQKQFEQWNRAKAELGQAACPSRNSVRFRFGVIR